MVLRDSLCMAGVGMIIGFRCAFAIGKILTSQLFKLRPLDPSIVLLSLAALLAIALLAAWIPARRAAGIEPMMALREE